MTRPPSPIRLLHVLPSFALGGTQRRVVSLVDGLGESFRHAIVPIDGRTDAVETARHPESFRFLEVAVEASRGIGLGNLARLRRLLLGERPDVLITYNWGAIEAALANRLFWGAPHLHCEDGFAGAAASAPEPRRRVLARRYILGHASRLALPSETLCALARESWKFPEHRILHLPNGIDTSCFAAVRAGRRTGGDDEIAVGTLARLSPEKNLHRLLRVFAAASERQRLRLLIAGDGPERASLEREAAALGVSAKVEFLGQVAEPSAVLARLDIFALTSDSEQMPYSVLEAMAAGLPVLASDVGDIAQMVSEENRFAVLPSASEDLMADALSALAASPAERESIGAANARRARERYDEAIMLSRYRALLTEMAGRAAEAGPAVASHRPAS